MGKRILSMALAGCLALMLAACGSSGGSVSDGEWAASPYTEDQLNQSDTLSMYAGAECYPIIAESVTVHIVNSGDEEEGYGVDFSVEKQTDDGWRVVPFREEASWIEIGVVLPAGGENEETIDLALLDLPIGSESIIGSYRVVKRVGGAVLTALFQMIDGVE